MSQQPIDSNYGECVGVWAPGDQIVSTLGTHVNNDLGQNGGVYTVVGVSYGGTAIPNPISYTSQRWAKMSGTSMAAPQVAAAAAYLADTFNLATPAALEAKLRDHFRTTGYVGSSNRAIFIIQLP